jgi:type VI protein secretion system component VasK
MPHRLIVAPLQNVLEFAVVSLGVVVATVDGLIDDKSWERITGKSGALFVLSVVLLVVWNANRLSGKRAAVREEARRKAEAADRRAEAAATEVRHKETMAMQERNAQKLMDLTVENIKAGARATHAIESMDSNIVRLTMELSDRPCQAATFKPCDEHRKGGE